MSGHDDPSGKTIFLIFLIFGFFSVSTFYLSKFAGCLCLFFLCSPLFGMMIEKDPK